MPDGHDDHVEVTPFPVLTSGQRLFFEVNGYVVVENTLAPDELQRTKDALLELRRTFAESGDPLNFNLHGCHADRFEPHFWSFSHLLQKPSCRDVKGHTLPPDRAKMYSLRPGLLYSNPFSFACLL